MKNTSICPSVFTYGTACKDIAVNQPIEPIQLVMLINKVNLGRLNKSDKAGALDALADIRKQY